MESLVKRVMDILGALFGLVVFSPIFLIMALLIKLEDPSGPIIYRNIRV